MKTFMYVDGENIFYQLVDILIQAKRITKRDELIKFDMKWLLCEAVRLKDQPKTIRYYGTKLHLIKGMGKATEARSLRMIQHKRAWGSWLSSQKIIYVTAGNLKARQSGKTISFQEKGVDVRLAVDMVQDACYSGKTHLVLVSSDSDLTPAVSAARLQKQKVTYVAFSETINKGMAFTATQTLTFTRDDVIEAYDRANIQKTGKQNG